MIQLARMQGMQVMLGCMTETTCAVTAATQLAPCAAHLDLDGNLLISNDPIRGGLQVIDGRVTLQTEPGLGLIPEFRVL
jgi:L-alanine-DL-glutamate epimerase-like enolase superfamily enzyme